MTNATRVSVTFNDGREFSAKLTFNDGSVVEVYFPGGRADPNLRMPNAAVAPG